VSKEVHYAVSDTHCSLYLTHNTHLNYIRVSARVTSADSNVFFLKSSINFKMLLFVYSNCTCRAHLNKIILIEGCDQLIILFYFNIIRFNNKFYYITKINNIVPSLQKRYN